MTKPLVRSVLVATLLLLATAAGADECRQNCVKIFQFCKQGCVDNYTGIQRRACKSGCRKAKKVSIRTCRTYPQVCPPIE
jgi:hypothetical protein